MKDKPPDDDIEYIQADLLEPLKGVWEAFRVFMNEPSRGQTRPFIEPELWRPINNLASKLGWDKEGKNE
jgi:hypothetical protein